MHAILIAGLGALLGTSPVSPTSARALPGPSAPRPPATAASPAPPSSQGADEAGTVQPVLKVPENYRVDVGDVISIGVVGHPEFDASAAVTSRGSIILPIVGEVVVGGLKLAEVEDRVVSILLNGYLADPRVVVELAEIHNMKVWVFGFVNQPGERRLTGPTTVTELLQLVGDLDANAGSQITIERRRPAVVEGPDGSRISVQETDTITVDLDALLRQGDLSQNLLLQNGDKIYVPSEATSARVGAFGEVAKPGFYPFRDGMTVSDLIELAGGTTEFANAKKIRIKRTNPAATLNVNLQKYFKAGEAENNVALKEGDVVVVNSSLFF